MTRKVNLKDIKERSRENFNELWLEWKPKPKPKN